MIEGDATTLVFWHNILFTRYGEHSQVYSSLCSAYQTCGLWDLLLDLTVLKCLLIMVWFAFKDW
jgi:hypothetical protein